MRLTQNVLERGYFEDFRKKLFSKLGTGEHLYLNLAAEASQFIRINAAKVRQIGTVEDAQLSLTFVLESAPGPLRKCSRTITLIGIAHEDLAEAERALAALRAEAPQLPVDPFALLPKNHGSSSKESQGRIPSLETAARELIVPVDGVDVAGIYAGGPMVRAMANSAGLTHWFATETFSFDYSLYTPSQRAVKGTYAGKEWVPSDYATSMNEARKKLEMLEKPARKLERGAYRAFLEPAALSDLIAMFSWRGISESAIRQGESSFRKVREGQLGFSKLFSLTEDFSGGETPRFNDEGELAPETLPIIAQGKLVNTLVSSRTAKEYGIASNGAAGHEGLRAPSVAAGSIPRSEILARLGTGLYLSNLHYLNWSDHLAGRVTGMTRYACFWVEDGKIVAPIENMRFDDTIYSLLGSSLEGLTSERSYLPEVGTYHMRNIGGMWLPGILVNEMKFTI